MQNIMTTKETIEKYFASIHRGSWESYIADDFEFINSNIDNIVRGKAAYVEAAKRFFRATTAVEIKRMVIEGDNVAVIARYQLRSPSGKTGVCDVAEMLTTQNGQITSSAIFFDTKAFAEFMAQGYL